MTSDKAIAQWIIEALEQMGVQTLVFSPGSRNAPLIIAGTAHSSMSHYTVLDERSAAFQAIGEALITQKPVAICCTSGSAVANYYPAVLEAFYSKVPIIIITADRPASRIGKGEGQSCVQSNFFDPHIGASYYLSEQSSKAEVQDAMNAAAKNIKDKSEPVHFNVSFEEPLYGQITKHEPIVIDAIEAKNSQQVDFEFFQPSLNVAIVCGQLNPHESEYLKEHKVLHQSNSTWFVDPLSGLLGEPNTVHIERIKEYSFDGLLSLGGQWMSKFPKFHVRDLKIKKHLHIDLYQGWDVSDTREFKWIKSTVVNAAKILLGSTALKVDSVSVIPPDIEWSDALAFKTILNGLKPTSVLHLGNSSIPRYLSYFSHKGKDFSNRGVSGIDGCLSTAVGAARADAQKEHTLIIGDQSVLYDSNALKELAELKNLRVFVLNNRLGAIFNWLPGSAQNSYQAKAVYSNYQEVQIDTLAIAYNCKVAKVQDVDGLLNVGKVHLVEVRTFGSPNVEQFRKLNNN